MNIIGFKKILRGPLATYLTISQKIGGHVAAHSVLVEQAFQAQLEFLTFVSHSMLPNENDKMILLQPTNQHVDAVQNFREQNRSSPYFNHLSSVSDSIAALGWVTSPLAPAAYVKEIIDASQFYSNRVLKEWKEKDKAHVYWVTAWTGTLIELKAYLSKYYVTGLVWGTGIMAKQTASALLPGAGRSTELYSPPLGSSMLPSESSKDVGLQSSDDHSDLFAEINQADAVAKKLKKIIQRRRSASSVLLGSTPYKAPKLVTKFTSVLPEEPVEKQPVFTKDGKKWLIEHQKGNHALIVDNTEMSNVAYLFKCDDSTVTVKGKINSITLDSCKKTLVVFDSVVSTVQFINCQSVQMQVLGKVPTISVDKTDGCQMYLSQESLDVELISSKSSEMNILVLKPDGDYTEYPVPEQYKTTVTPAGLNTLAVESKG